MKKTITKTIAISLLLLVAVCGGCGKKSFETQLKNAALIHEGDTEWEVWWKLGSPHSRKKVEREGLGIPDIFYEAHYNYGDSTLKVTYWDINGYHNELIVKYIAYSTPAGKGMVDLTPRPSRWEKE